MKIYCYILMLILISSTVFALPEATNSISPNSFFWAFDIVLERLEINLAQNPDAKATIAINHIIERKMELEELGTIPNVNETDYERGADRLSKDLEDIDLNLAKIENSQRKAELKTIAEEAQRNSLLVLQSVKARLEEKGVTQKGIDTAISNSQKSRGNNVQ